MCGDNLTRENVMKQAASLKDFRTEVLLPGIKINTSATNFAPISQLQLQRFKGERAHEERRAALAPGHVAHHAGCVALSMLS